MQPGYCQFLQTLNGEYVITNAAELYARKVDRKVIRFMNIVNPLNPAATEMTNNFWEEHVMFVTLDRGLTATPVIATNYDTNPWKVNFEIVNQDFSGFAGYELNPEMGDKVYLTSDALFADFDSSEADDVTTPINESKHVMTKKFTEENFDKKGDYLYPKKGNKNCSLHSEYDKGLLKFFAKHGIKELHSLSKSNVPQIGFSEDEQKWYGWSHRAIFGFGVGDSVKKGCCGYEQMKEEGVTKAKDLKDAKRMAEIFAEDVS